MSAVKFRIGCAGWTIPPAHMDHFPTQGSHLQRYAQVFPAAEINSSFYRAHTAATYARWKRLVPENFQFAVKVPREITHAGRLACLSTLHRFLSDAGALGQKLGPLLVQLPPGLAFDSRVVGTFFDEMNKRFGGSVVCEPRHASWFTSEVSRLLAGFQVARVAVDPAPWPMAAEPGGWDHLVYYRLHGSPKKYYSAYSAEYLDALARSLAELARSASVWCIFDNTALGAATMNALFLMKRLPEDDDRGNL